MSISTAFQMPAAGPMTMSTYSGSYLNPALAMLFAPPTFLTGSSGSVGVTDRHLVLGSSVDFSLVLPASSIYGGRPLSFKNVVDHALSSTAANVIPLGSTTPGTAILASTKGKWAEAIADGLGNWVIMRSN